MRVILAVCWGLLAACSPVLTTPVPTSDGTTTPPAQQDAAGLPTITPLRAGAASPEATDTPSPSAPSPVAGQQSQLPRLTAVQARAAATVVTFLDAYNAGRLDAALALLADQFAWSDCDYRKGYTVRTADGRGKESFAAWLRERIDDHDRLVLDDLYFGVPNEIGQFAVAVSYARRTSDTLRALGFPDGIVPQTATKVGVAKTGERIVVFANGPYGGSPESCQPRPT